MVVAITAVDVIHPALSEAAIDEIVAQSPIDGVVALVGIIVISIRPAP